MRCPNCGGDIRFQKRDIVCSACSWTPSQAVMQMYRLAPMTNRRILLATLSVLVSAGICFILYDLVLPALILGICGIALVPVNFVIRSYAVKKMMEQLEGI